jgi:hypothetical protein
MVLGCIDWQGGNHRERSTSTGTPGSYRSLKLIVFVHKELDSTSLLSASAGQGPKNDEFPTVVPTEWQGRYVSTQQRQSPPAV